MKRTGAQILWECLVREGVSTVFGYPGGAILPAYDAMLDYPIRHVLVRHEQGATHMADGYARASGKVGVAIATSGPGATNMVTGIATAMMDSSPIVCITGQVGSKLIRMRRLPGNRHHRRHAAGDEAQLPGHARARIVAPAVREAFAIAAVGRPGPVLIDITKDAQQTLVRVRLGRRDAPAARPAGAGARSGGLSAALELINSRRTADDSGGPRHHPRRAPTDIVRFFAERAQIPIVDDAPRHRRHSRRRIR